MLREYELMYIVRPELDDDAVRAATDGVQSLVENIGGEVIKTTPWGKRRLAYEVQHLRDGHYVLAQLRLEATRVGELERALRISDTVFRHLLVVDESGASADEGDGDGVESASRTETAGHATAAGPADSATAAGEQPRGVADTETAPEEGAAAGSLAATDPVEEPAATAPALTATSSDEEA
ncbi:MAG: 30S ribosomal protein S6 [Candidatus Dormibacteria bacterium]